MADNDNPLLTGETPPPRTLAQRVGRFFGSTLVNGIIGTVVGGAVGVGVEGVQTAMGTSGTPAPTTPSGEDKPNGVETGTALQAEGASLTAAGNNVGGTLGGMVSSLGAAQTKLGTDMINDANAAGVSKPAFTPPQPYVSTSGPDMGGTYDSLLAEGEAASKAFKAAEDAKAAAAAADARAAGGVSGLTGPGLDVGGGPISTIRGTFTPGVVPVTGPVAEAAPAAPAGDVPAATTKGAAAMAMSGGMGGSSTGFSAAKVPTTAAPDLSSEPKPEVSGGVAASDAKPLTAATEPKSFMSRAWDDAKDGMKIGAGVGAGAGALKAMIVGPHTERLAQERAARGQGQDGPTPT